LYHEEESFVIAKLLQVAIIGSCTLASGLIAAREIADTIHTGGPILTIDDARPTVEAFAAKSGRILAAGDLAKVSAYDGEGTQRFGLAGRTMLPGFVDSHGHVVFGKLQALSANLLAPPDGEVTDIASLQEMLKTWMTNNADAVERVKVVVGFGYDNAQLAELRHPTRDDLDAVATDYPVIIVHQSGHLGVVNSKALEAAGVDANTQDPPGGVYQRDASGAPNGVMEEYAFFPVLVKNLAGLGAEGLVTFTRAGSKL
jgi:predicted amidohydrolase YtcJ